MAYLDTNHQRAGFLLLLLGAALVFALSPFATGLLGIPVLYVIFQPTQEWLAPRVGARTAAMAVVTIALLLIVVPGVGFAGLIVSQAQEIANGMVQNPFLARLAGLRGGGAIAGMRLAEIGSTLAKWLGNSAFGFIGSAMLLALNVLIALFGLYYILLRPGDTWDAISPYIPFSTETQLKLRMRFRNVTTSTVIGIGVTSLLQGILVGLGFWATGLTHVPFWSVVTIVVAIVPVVGSALVWVPGAFTLALEHRYGAAAGLAAWSLVTLGVVEHVIRPMVFRRWARIHALTALVGALAGVPYFGILGLLIGPLAISYFMELSGLYREEFLPVSSPAGRETAHARRARLHEAARVH